MKITAFFQGFGKKDGLFPWQYSEEYLASSTLGKTFFFPRIGEKGADFNFVIGK
jgi:hypothetical protein